MKTRTNQVLVMTTIVLLLSGFYPATAQTDDVTFPEFKVDTETFDTNDGNDLYLQSESYHAIFPHSMKFTGDMDHMFDYFGMLSPDYRGNRLEDATFTDDAPGIMQFLNGTTEQQTLEYRRSYYSLLDTGDAEGDRILITSGQTYVFSIGVDEVSPSFLRILAATVGGTGAGNSFTLTTNVLTPSGNTASNSITVTAGITNYIPFVPGETGEFIFTIQTSKNVILDHFGIEQEPEIEDVERSYSEQFEGDDTIAKFIRLNPSDSSQTVWDVNSIVYNSQYLVDAVTYVTPGSLSAYLFQGGNNDPLSTDVSSIDSTFTSDEAVYVAVVVQPPNEKDPDIRKAQEDGLIDGIDIEFLISGENFPITELPENSNFETTIEEAYEQSGTKYYSFTASNTVLMGVNSSTTNDGMTFVSLDQDNPSVSLDPNTHNVRYDTTDDAAVFAPGDYIVGLPTNERYQFQVFIPEEFGMNLTKTLNQTYQDVKFYHLGSTGYTQDLLNVTYIDQLNQSATFDLSYFDLTGNQEQDIVTTFSHYYDNGTADFVINNNTEFTSTSIPRNINGVYLRVGVTANAQYNTTGWDELTDNTTISSTIEIDRLNNLLIQANESLTTNYYFNSLSTSSSISHDLNGSISTINDYLTINAAMNSAYRITIDTTNRTLNDWFLFSTNTEEWTSLAQFKSAVFTSYTANVSGIIHNYYEIEFASTHPITFGLRIAYDNNLVNGTTAISMEELNIQSFPELDIGNLGEVEIGTEDGFDVGRALIIGGVVVAGIGIIAGIVILLKRRGVF